MEHDIYGHHYSYLPHMGDTIHWLSYFIMIGQQRLISSDNLVCFDSVIKYYNH